MKTLKEIQSMLILYGIPESVEIRLTKEIHLLLQETFMEGKIEEFNDNTKRTDKLLERFGV